MAGTYYKYAERNADSQVNWAEVGKGMSDMLAETNRVREEKKAALDVSQREILKYLAETPNGEHVSARESILQLSDKLSNQMRINYNLMKRGMLNPKDFMIARQNISDDTNLAFNANKAYQESYGDIMNRKRDGISSGLELDNASEVEGFGDWKNIGWEIAPNGTIMAGKMIEEDIDGKKVKTLDKTPGGLRSMTYLNQAILGRIDKYDYETPVKRFTDGVGSDIKSTIILGKTQKMGKITSINDITSRENINPEDKSILFKFITAENDAIQAICGTDLDTTRILYDSAKVAPNKEPYKITTDPEQAKKGNNYILKVVDPSSGGFKYELTASQKKDAEEFIRGQMRAQYKYEEKKEAIGAVSPYDEPEYKFRKKQADKEASNAANMIGKLWYGNDNEVQSGIDYFKGMKDKDGNILFKDIDRAGNGINVVLRNGETEFLSFVNSDGTPKTQEDFIRSAGPLLAGQLDVNTALQKGSYQKGKQFNKESKGRATTVTPKDNYKDYITSKIKKDVIGLSESEAVSKLKEVAAIGGFELLEAEPGYNAMEIAIPDGKGGYSGSATFSLNEKDATTQQDTYDAMIKYMVGNASDTTIKANLKGGTKTEVKKRIGGY